MNLRDISDDLTENEFCALQEGMREDFQYTSVADAKRRARQIIDEAKAYEESDNRANAYHSRIDSE